MARIDVLLKQLEIAHKGDRQLGGFIMLVKGWAVTLLLGMAAVYPEFTYSLQSLKFACESILLFGLLWVVEALMGAYQKPYYEKRDKIQESIQDELRGNPDSRDLIFVPYDKGIDQFEAVKKDFRICLFRPSVGPFYLAIMSILPLLYDWKSLCLVMFPLGFYVGGFSKSKKKREEQDQYSNEGNDQVEGNDRMSTNLIRDHTSALVEGMVKRAQSIQEVQHDLDKGILRELFLKDLLNFFLTSQFSACSGHIIDSNGEQSSQQDIIIFDNRVLPAFIREQNVGFVPAESVLATIEVKSTLKKEDLLNANGKSEGLADMYRRIEIELGRKIEMGKNKKIFNELKDYPKPMSCVFGFKTEGFPKLRDETRGEQWLDKNLKHLKAICVAGEYSWICVNKKWSWKEGDARFEETKRFIAVLLDNCRTYSEDRNHLYLKTHQDWLTSYIRDL